MATPNRLTNSVWNSYQRALFEHQHGVNTHCTQYSGRFTNAVSFNLILSTAKIRHRSRLVPNTTRLRPPTCKSSWMPSFLCFRISSSQHSLAASNCFLTHLGKLSCSIAARSGVNPRWLLGFASNTPSCSRTKQVQMPRIVPNITWPRPSSFKSCLQRSLYAIFLVFPHIPSPQCSLAAGFLTYLGKHSCSIAAMSGVNPRRLSEFASNTSSCSRTVKTSMTFADVRCHVWLMRRCGYPTAACIGVP